MCKNTFSYSLCRDFKSNITTFLKFITNERKAFSAVHNYNLLSLNQSSIIIFEVPLCSSHTHEAIFM